MRGFPARAIALVLCAALLAGLSGCVFVGDSLLRSARSFTEAAMTRTYEGDFTAVVLRDFIAAAHLDAGENRVEIIYAQGAEPSLSVTAPEDLFGFLRVGFRGGTATIEGERDIAYDFDACTMVITAPLLTRLELSGSIRMTTRDDIVADAVSLIFNGAADTDAGFHAGDISLTLNGAGSAILRGTASSVAMTLNGASDVQAGDLDAQSANVRINGAGTAVVSAAQSLEAAIAGAGTITYYGDPSVTQSIAGLGSISRGIRQ